VRDGQCEVTRPDGKLCCVGPGIWPCAKPLNFGGRFCTHHDLAKFTGLQCAATKGGGLLCRVFSGSAYVHVGGGAAAAAAAEG